MELQEPRKKKNYKFKKYVPLVEMQKKMHSIFNGFSVIIEKSDDMKCIHERGFFGKASLSRSFPSFRQTEILRERQYLKRIKWTNKTSKDLRKVIVVPDSDTDDEDYFTNLEPKYQIDKSDVKENLCLSLVEGYYLAINIKCLNVYAEDILLDKMTMWKTFSDNDIYFVPNYITYSHFREKGWVVKAGIKFGGDYILYKDGPPYYHASYVVIIDVVNENLTRKQDMQRRSMEIVSIIGLNRLCETAGKELLICQLIWPTNLSFVTHEDLPKITINEILIRRWSEAQEN